ncbi:MAG: hypothetical protein MK161_06645 [Pirellulales bacterium]|jgi:hypothetical protein|nr:hypothetical protein [Pirellulales bacterium]
MLTNPDSVDHRAMPPRPDFMIVLGLMPPYMEDDVKQAFLEKVKAAHPDHGGSPEAFGKLEDAYQQALQYVSFRSDRRGWIGARMEEYLAQQSVISDLEEKGANVVIESIDWLQRSFGEFATLTERVIAVQIADKSQATDVLNVVKQEHLLLDGVKELDLSGCEITDDLVYELRVLRSLVVLDLCNTPITNTALGIVHWLPALQILRLDGTKTSWWQRRKAKRFLAHRMKQAGAIDAAVHPVNVR